MSSMANGALLALGLGGLAITAYFSLHYFAHRDRRRANRRNRPGRRGSGRREEDR